MQILLLAALSAATSLTCMALRCLVEMTRLHLLQLHPILILQRSRSRISAFSVQAFLEIFSRTVATGQVVRIIWKRQYR
jgi:hypothetical protein